MLYGLLFGLLVWFTLLARGGMLQVCFPVFGFVTVGLLCLCVCCGIWMLVLCLFCCRGFLEFVLHLCFLLLLFGLRVGWYSVFTVIRVSALNFDWFGCFVWFVKLVLA